ncbi:MAG: endonuclease/exonuclease/phosphatase family protein [Dermatophilaceae bacterium]|nr:endonuclease/exonuclease/phosphatase family protein [Intrasporangiaceae bacterium]
MTIGRTTDAIEGRHLTRWWRALTVALVLLLGLATAGVAGATPGKGQGGKPAGKPAAAAQAQGGPPVTVMTRNIYLGSELGGLFAAGTPELLVEAASEVWANVLASDFPARAEVLADEVDEHRPMLVGLQEVSLFTAKNAAGGSISIDFLEILLDALTDAGLHYRAVAVSPSFTGTLPAFDPTLGFVQATLIDRDVILVRSDVPPAQLTVLDEQVGIFDAALALPVLGQPLRIDRGWGYVDVRVRNREFRFVNTHFEAFDPGEFIRVQQAQELLDGPLDTDLPVVLLGDFNSNAEAGGLAYGILIKGGGFEDAWSIANPGDPGLTCCHDADLRNEDVALRSRIDLILVRDGVRVRDLERVGIDPAMRTPAGLWPSDHAGVVGRVMITAK